MLAAAQWCPIVVSNVSTFFMYIYALAAQKVVGSIPREHTYC